jgi:peptidoglycan hydrolase-like protein with peptidoglycan-binding domain
VQQQLLDLGYEPGVVDGYLGKGTIKAIKKFQIENNLAVTGQADMKTISMLEQKTKGQSKQTSTQPLIQETTQQTEQAVPPTQEMTQPTEKAPPPTSKKASGATTKQNSSYPSTVSPMDL